MALDRGILARIDRMVLSELDHGSGMQLVKVPVSEAVWSIWRRYCQAIGMTMGGGIAGLIAHELGMIVDTSGHSEVVFASDLERKLIARSDELDARERRLNEREHSLRASERLMRASTRPLLRPSTASVGRNDPCPCGSGYKYKRCHGN